jgi:predicted  nucleic acid-binding Zn-ribbon protein
MDWVAVLGAVASVLGILTLAAAAARWAFHKMMSSIKAELAPVREEVTTSDNGRTTLKERVTDLQRDFGVFKTESFAHLTEARKDARSARTEAAKAVQMALTVEKHLTHQDERIDGLYKAIATK